MQGKARQATKSRSDETCIKNLQIFAYKTLQMKKQSIGKHNSMTAGNFGVLFCELGAWMPDYKRGQNNLLNLA